MKRIGYFSWSILWALMACQPSTQSPEQKPESMKIERVPEKVKVYQTAENSEDRMTMIEETKLVDFGQPTERQPAVFVDPSHQFQTFVGIAVR